MLISERTALSQLKKVLERVGIEYIETLEWGNAPAELRFTDATSMTVQLDFINAAGPARVRRWLYDTRDVHVDYLILTAPWLSEQAMQLCADANRGALDLTGNYRLNLRHYYLERLGNPPPAATQRDTKSLFKGKSLRVVRAILAAPQVDWSIQSIAKTAQVSIGYASTVRRRLIDQGLVPETGLAMTPLDATLLLQRWAESQGKRNNQVISAYSLAQGTRLIQRLKTLPDPGHHVLLASSSAAEWMTPYLQDQRNHFVADALGYEHLRQHLSLEETARGANVTIELTEDEGIFLDRFEAVEGVWTTSPTQTYVDLFQQGNRGRQAAEKLLDGYLKPLWAGKKSYVSWPLGDEL